MKNSDKCVAARLWKNDLKIVTVEWLLACLKTWSRVDEESYLLTEKKEANEDDISTADEEGSDSEMSAALDGVPVLNEGQVAPVSPVMEQEQESPPAVPVGSVEIQDPAVVPVLSAQDMETEPSIVAQEEPAQRSADSVPAPQSLPLPTDESQLLAPQSMLVAMASAQNEQLEPISNKRPLDESSIASKRQTLTSEHNESLNPKVFLLSSEGLDDATAIITQLGGSVIQTHE